MDINDVALRDLPNVALVVDLSVYNRPRALVRFENAREFLIVWSTRAHRFEVTHRLKLENRAAFMEERIEPFDDFEGVRDYLAWRSARPMEEGVSFLPLEEVVSREILGTPFRGRAWPDTAQPPRYTYGRDLSEGEYLHRAWRCIRLSLFTLVLCGAMTFAAEHTPRAWEIACRIGAIATAITALVSAWKMRDNLRAGGHW